jgi:8-oxo-dGTP diphosphatase
MSHIHTESGQHDHTVSAFIVRMQDSTPQILLHRHKKLGVYLQFGGHVELHENPWQAITHELKEESGYAMDQLSILQPKERIEKLSRGVSHPQPVNINTHAFGDDGKHFHTDIVYAFVADQLPRHAPGDGESAEMRWFTRQELVSLSPDQVFSDIKEIALFIFDTILANWNAVPIASTQ